MDELIQLISSLTFTIYIFWFAHQLRVLISVVKRYYSKYYEVLKQNFGELRAVTFQKTAAPSVTPLACPSHMCFVVGLCCQLSCHFGFLSKVIQNLYSGYHFDFNSEHLLTNFKKKNIIIKNEGHHQRQHHKMTLYLNFRLKPRIRSC